MSILSVRYNPNLVQNKVAFKATVPNAVQNPPTEQREKMSSGIKLGIGLGLTAIATIGIYIATKGKAKPETKTIEQPPRPLAKLKEMTIQKFKENGKFQKGQAILNDGSNYTGKITTQTKDGKNIIIEYKNGGLQKSSKIDRENIIWSKDYSKNKIGNHIVTISSLDGVQNINLTQTNNIVKLDQEQLKNLLENNASLSSKQFKEKTDRINYKSAQQKVEIKEIIKSKEIKEVEKYLKEEEKELEKLKLEKEKSDLRNSQWLNREHIKKEEEYSDWWVKSLREIERPRREILQKEIKILKEELEKDKQLFISEYSRSLPDIEERFNVYKKDLRIEYGNVFAHKVEEAKNYIRNDNNYLEYLWARTPKIEKMIFELNLKHLEAYNPESFYYFNKAMNEMEKRNISYDKNSLFFLDENIIKSIANGKFTSEDYSEALGHNIAYRINGALRCGGKVDDAIVAILDEGFKNVSPLSEDAVVYRQVVGNSIDKSIDFINKLIKAKKGDTFIDKAYSYTTYYENCATSCNGIKDKGAPWIILKIKLPKGAKISNGSQYEQREALLPRNAKFKIVEEAKLVKHTEDGDFMEITVEYF